MAPAALELAPGPPAGLPDVPAVMGRAGGENFPVAARLLSARERRALLAVYGFARLADELGDEYDGDRLAALDWLEQELDRACAGRARTPLLVSLQRAIAECALPRAPFARLIEANRVDQRVGRVGSPYETWEQLRAYCELSANPVGELVLAIFGLHTPARVRLSDSVCTGLQLTEHLQDVGEDLRRGRIYLPREDLVRFGCSHEDLTALVAGGSEGGGGVGPLAGGMAPVRRTHGRGVDVAEVVAFEVRRARELLWAGAPLAASIPGWRPRLAIAAFAGGGLAALEQIERAGYEVLADCRSPRSAIGGASPAPRWLRARWTGRVLRRARRTAA